MVPRFIVIKLAHDRLPDGGLRYLITQVRLLFPTLRERRSPVIGSSVESASGPTRCRRTEAIVDAAVERQDRGSVLSVDIKWILNSHAHSDHAGGMAQLAHDTGVMTQ
ncbi:MBL fold metallo-hydrolase [Rhodanobacter denitrificans]|nr:MBL fold metallo-hydrolase [Rhodanobacter denitrificans]